MNSIKNLTQSRLKELLHYDPDTGIFTWLTSVSNRAMKGSRAGSYQSKGYIRIIISGNAYLAHRLSFLYMTGKWPIIQVDHINNERDDNRWSNLRNCSPTQNQGNRSININNTSGYKGVSKHNKTSRWRSYIRIKNENVYLGLFDCKHEAAKAYNAAALKYFGEFAYLNVIEG